MSGPPPFAMIPHCPQWSAFLAQRIHKVLARAGLGSRRTVEGWIEAGRIRVNDHVVAAGASADVGDRIHLDARRFRVAEERRRARWLRYHKPEGRVSTRSDPDGRPTVFDALPRLGAAGGRWVSLGRLDVNTTGLMLFTDNGDLANALTHPSAGIEREYAVRVRGPVAPDTLERLARGIALDDGEARFERITDAGGQGANHWYHVVLREGRRNEVRRLWAAVGCQVARLIRVRFGPVTLGRHLRPGRFEDLAAKEVGALQGLAGADYDTPRLTLVPEPERGRRSRAGSGGRKRSAAAGRKRR